MVERWRLKEPFSTSKYSALFSWSLFKLGGGFSASYKLLLNTLIYCSVNITSGLLHTQGVQICLHKEACARLRSGGKLHVSQRGWLGVYLTFLHAAINHIYHVEKVNVSFAQDRPKVLHSIDSLWGMQRELDFFEF